MRGGVSVAEILWGIFNFRFIGNEHCMPKCIYVLFKYFETWKKKRIIYNNKEKQEGGVGGWRSGDVQKRPEAGSRVQRLKVMFESE